MKGNWQTVVIVGAQWGDEGKGKVTDYYGPQTDFVVRFQGGNNAGHTIVHEGKTYKLHLLPSGVLHAHNQVVLANGVVIDPRVLLEELARLEEAGIKIQLRISDRAHVIFPFQILMDSASESAGTASKFSALSTQRGIWPTYSDKAARVGIRMADLINPEVFEEKFDLLFELQQKKLRLIYGTEAELDREKIRSDYRRFADLLRPMVCNVSLLLHEALESGKKVLFEGAQGAMLDVDHGLYPYTTSSNTTSGSVCTGAGVPPQKINRVVAVVKAYLSRVGGGYLPTELKDSLGDEIRETGGEYGTTTGRARRIGWLDLVQLKMACRINGFTSLAITKIDVLDKLKEIKVCTAYRCFGEIITEMPADLSEYNACEPVYETFPGWECPSSHIRRYEDLPENMRRYIEYIEAALKVPAELVSVGPDRMATIVKS